MKEKFENEEDVLQPWTGMEIKTVKVTLIRTAGSFQHPETSSVTSFSVTFVKEADEIQKSSCKLAQTTHILRASPEKEDAGALPFRRSKGAQAQGVSYLRGCPHSQKKPVIFRL